MELYNLLVRPDADFELRWHRDDIPADASADQEMARLAEPGFHAQWNLALYDDASLVVVPGSHLRARTEAERNADPFSKFMPGQKVVQMKAGDVVFYNNNILCVNPGTDLVLFSSLSLTKFADLNYHTKVLFH